MAFFALPREPRTATFPSSALVRASLMYSLRRSSVREGRTTRRLSPLRSEEHTSELQSRGHLVCRLLLEKKNINLSFMYVHCLYELLHFSFVQNIHLIS